MFITNPHYDAILAREHVHRLRAEVAAERLRGAASLMRSRCVAASLRRAADRLDAGSPARKTAIQC